MVLWFSNPVYINGVLYSKPEHLKYFNNTQEAIAFAHSKHLDAICQYQICDVRAWESNYKGKLIKIA